MVHYLIHADGRAYHGEVRPSSQEYLRRFVLPNLQAIPDALYTGGLLAVQHSLAKSVYLVEGEDLYWLIEWSPGLIVVRVRPEGPLEAAALRSPIPTFGGREPLPDEDPDHDPEINHQYNLIFDAWTRSSTS